VETLQEQLKESQFIRGANKRGSNTISVSTNNNTSQIDQCNVLLAENTSLMTTLQRLEKEHKVVISAKDKQIQTYREESTKWRKNYEELFCSLLRKEGIPKNLLSTLKSFHEGKDLTATLSAQFEELKEAYFRSLATTIKLNMALRGKSLNFFNIDELYKRAHQTETDWHSWNAWLIEQIQPTKKTQVTSWWT